MPKFINVNLDYQSNCELTVFSFYYDVVQWQDHKEFSWINKTEMELDRKSRK